MVSYLHYIGTAFHRFTSEEDVNFVHPYPLRSVSYNVGIFLVRGL